MHLFDGDIKTTVIVLIKKKYMVKKKIEN